LASKKLPAKKRKEFAARAGSRRLSDQKISRLFQKKRAGFLAEKIRALLVNFVSKLLHIYL
jgi:hypothetical protein